MKVMYMMQIFPRIPNIPSTSSESSPFLNNDAIIISSISHHQFYHAILIVIGTSYETAQTAMIKTAIFTKLMYDM